MKAAAEKLSQDTEIQQIFAKMYQQSGGDAAGAGAAAEGQGSAHSASSRKSDDPNVVDADVEDVSDKK